MGKDDAAVVGEAEAGIVGNLPGVPVEITEHAREAAAVSCASNAVAQLSTS